MKIRTLIPLISMIVLSGSLMSYSQSPKKDTQPQIPAAFDHFDPSPFAMELAQAQNEAQRFSVFERRWQTLKPIIAYIRSLETAKFHKTVAFWQAGFLATGRQWTGVSEGDLREAWIREGKNSFLVQGDCLENISSSEAALVHIYGDLNAEVSVKGISEIVIGGDIKAKGSIKGDGIVAIYVGGKVEGKIRNMGSSYIWLNGSLPGEVSTGSPSTALHVMGDVSGRIVHSDKAALLSLDVHGFMPWNILEETGKLPYTEFVASVGMGDKPPGLYKCPVCKNSNRIWVIHNQVNVAP